MKTKNTKNIVAALALLTGSAAQAQDLLAAPGWYGGANLGLTRASIDDDRIANDLAAQGFTQTAIQKDTRDTGFKVFGGYQLNRHFALEGGYFDLGQFDFSATTQPAGSLSGKAKFRGVNLDVQGRLPLTDRLSAFARAGLIYAETQATFTSTGAVQVADARRKEKAANYKAGVGLEFALSPQLAARAELERYRVKDGVGNQGDVDMASLGLVYRFGKTAVAVSTPEPVREVVAAPPAAPPPMERSLTLSADSQFDFDQAIVKPEGQRALDKFATELKGYRYEAITVTGHADHLGSEDYNADLSARRAEAVKNYLSASGGIPAARIEARGAGETQPLTRPDECPAMSTPPSLALIACLQANRRVEVKALASP